MKTIHLNSGAYTSTELLDEDCSIAIDHDPDPKLSLE